MRGVGLRSVLVHTIRNKYQVFSLHFGARGLVCDGGMVGATAAMTWRGYLIVMERDEGRKEGREGGKGSGAVGRLCTGNLGEGRWSVLSPVLDPALLVYLRRAEAAVDGGLW